MSPLPVLLAGGNGLRLAPLGMGEVPPKPFWPLADAAHSLLQSAALRVAPFSDSPLLVVQERWAELAAAQLHAVGITAHILAEPEPRNTAAAALIAALEIAKTEPGKILCLLPCDHWIDDERRFRETLLQAAKQAAKDGIACLGILPRGPSSAYGYLLPESESGKVRRFVEKPESAQAAELIAKGARWNAGIFLARPAMLVQAFRDHAPEIFAAATLAYATGRDGCFDPAAYHAIPAHPIDRAVMEKSDRLWMTEAAFNWADLGDWDSVFAHRGEDHQLSLRPPCPLSVAMHHGGIELLPGPGGECCLRRRITERHHA